MSSETFKISDFSPHLFWDVDRKSLDFENNKAFIVQNVLEYGLLKDWEIISKKYGVMEIANVAKGFRNLDARALSFIAHLSREPLKSFRCYSTKRSLPPQANF